MNIRTLEIRISLGDGSDAVSTHFNVTVPDTADAHASLAYMATDIIQEDRLRAVLRQLELELANKKQEEPAELDIPGYNDAKRSIAKNSVDAARAAAGIYAPELPLEFKDSTGE